MATKPVLLEIVSDVMCPWCYIGKRRLEKALKLVKAIEIDTQWRPFQLDETIPEDGMSRSVYLATKFGGEDRARKTYKQIEEVGHSEELPFAFDLIEKSPNTLNAHRLIRWSQSTGHQDALVERLFQLFFIEGADIGDITVLVDAADEIGMERNVIERLIKSDTDRAEIKADIAHARQIGVTGVPCFIIDQKYVVMGAQQPETIAQALQRAFAKR